MDKLFIYNTLTRKKEEFKPINPGFVGIYVCGPTVYGHAHLGHAKSYISFDVVVRYFRYLGYKVRYVQNITDVGHLESDADEGEDKLAKQARQEKMEPMEIAENYTRSYFEDMDRIGVLRPDISPRASGHIIEQIEMIKTLISKGLAYESGGNVYFDVNNYPQYGKLSGRKLDEIESGTRVEIKQDKKHPADFALWKKANPEHIMQWPSPWGNGYPGWHVECSVMSTKYLGETFDIHGGGLENMFPHHECEIAQSEGAHGRPFVNYWIHNNMVTVNGVKMGKSLGNFINLKEAFEKYLPMAIRYYILTSHYRSNLDFTDESIEAAGKGLKKINETFARLITQAESAKEAVSGTILEYEKYEKNFRAAMNDDFNTPQAIAALFDFLKSVNQKLDQSAGKIGKKEILATIETIKRTAGDVLGILGAGEQSESGRLKNVMGLVIELRDEFRKEKNYKMSDYIRDKLNDIGIEIKDTAQGTEWR